jgi:hypothetical protein
LAFFVQTSDLLAGRSKLFGQLVNPLRRGVSSLCEGFFELGGLASGLIRNCTDRRGGILPMTREGGRGGTRGLPPRDLLVDDLQFDRANREPIAGRQLRQIEGASVEPRVFVDPPDEGRLRTAENETMPWLDACRSQTERTSLVRADGAFEVGQSDDVPTMLAAAHAQDQIVRWRA